MSRSVSVVVPVKDGARYLNEVLTAVLQQGPDELLVIDSGSTDGSVELARAAGATILEIAPHEFGHGRTRNLGAERTTGDIICFLTQDATPLAGWLDAFRESFELTERVGAAYGPHRPRPETSPMIARELEEFFAGHEPRWGGPAVQRAGDDAYLSNVNAAYLRECWVRIRFPDVPYAEDQAFGRAMLAAGWAKVFHPRAAVLHAHDYPPADFMRRYFDEYRGLRETIGHVEGFGVRSSAKQVRAMISADRAWMRRHGMSRREITRWSARGAVHHGGRKVFSALGSRAHALPPGVQRRMSLEGTAVTVEPPPPPPGPPRGTPVAPYGPSFYEAVREVAAEGPAPLLDGLPGMADRAHLHVAAVIPPFRRGSGGHNSIFQILTRLEGRGHTVSVWLDDPLGWQASEWPAVVRENIREYFAPLEGPVFKGFDDWYGADVVVATGWQTVHPALRRERCRARAYLVHDHEPEFYATSAEAYWAEQTYSFGLHSICASPWLADIVRGRYGGSTSLFDFGVDHGVYFPRPARRRRDTVVFYAREVTPRRAVPLGMLALEELHRRRPDLRIVLFGDDQPNKAPFPYEHLGIASPDELAWAYSEATVGLCLSMTNYSLIPQEMLACGLPCVDLAGFSAETVFGPDGPVELSPFDPLELADAIERLIDDEELWARRSRAGVEFVGGRTWDHAAQQVEAGLREALRRRELEYGSPEYDPDGFVREPSQLAPGAAPPPGLDASTRSIPVDEVRSQPATRRLLATLDPEDVAAVEASVRGELARHYERATSDEKARLTLSLGVHHRVPAVLAKTGLTPDEPPESVHAMGRGPLAAGGDYYTADLVADAVERAGGSMQDVRRALDFGCSSGRVVRALAPAYPEIEWHGVDPNREAIAWAGEHMARASFAVSPTDPPLGFASESFDLAFAISIWSHFNEGAGLAWLEEMRRVLGPGGRLVLTTHGLRSVQYYAELGTRPPRQLEQIRRALYRRGFWFAPEFGEAGDYGVHHPEWGTAFFTPEWLLAHVAGHWTVEDYGVGRNASNQDVVVLRRR